MTKPVIRRPLAQQDIEVITDYLALRAPLAALRFLDAVEAMVKVLGDYPDIGSTRHAAWFAGDLANVRFLPIRGFDRILIYYFVTESAVEIIRFWDAARGLDALSEAH